MLNVHQLRTGMFLIQWTPKETLPQKREDCGLNFSKEAISVEYNGRRSIYEVEYKCYWSMLRVVITSQPSADQPEKITAILCGKQKELEKNYLGWWRKSWYDLISEHDNCFCWQKPNLVLTLDFRNSGEETVVNHLSHLLTSKSLADVHFIVQGEKISAHRAILGSASPVFKAMFLDTKNVKGNSEIIEITDVSLDVFKCLLRFVYTGKVPSVEMSDLMIEWLFFAAMKYEIQSLKDVCEEVLVQKVSPGNAIPYLRIAYLSFAHKLIEASLECIDSNHQSIWSSREWQDLMKEHPHLFVQISRRMAEKHPLQS